MPWQCLSVCLSIRLSVHVFRTFLQHALRYQFETWYIHSIGGMTCWVASQLGLFDLVYSPKWVKPIFCNHGLIGLIAYRSRQILQIWYTGGLLYSSRHKFCFFVTILFSEFWQLFLRVFFFFFTFSRLFFYMFEIAVWNLVHPCSRWCYMSGSSFIPVGTLWPTLQSKIGQSHLSTFIALKII